MHILDCTLRDGGYYNQWDFEKPTVDAYIKPLDQLPIDYIEIGYRSPLQDGYYGKYFYLPLYELKDLKEKSKKKFVVMLNEKQVRLEHLPELVAPIKGLVDMVRLAVKPENLNRAISLGKAIKDYGFQVTFNVMYLSKWKDNANFISQLEQLNGVADIFYIVDSFGGIFPGELETLIKQFKEKLDCPLGFHGHNNLETALVNTLTAIENGVDYVDATMMGMGRGAGNLKTELLLTVLSKTRRLQVDFDALEAALGAIRPLHEKYRWGANLPFMISGANSLPQQEVMERITVRYYTLNTIIHSLDKGGHTKNGDGEFPPPDFEKCETLLISGGGPSVGPNMDGLENLLRKNPDIPIIHASSKNAAYFKDLPNKQYFCLVGNEGRRMKKKLRDLSTFNGCCILPPYPITIDTFVPDEVRENTAELRAISFTDKYHDAHTAIALQSALNCQPRKILFIGYDGYAPEDIGQKERKLIKENEYLFRKLKAHRISLTSLTETNYSLPAHDNLFFRLAKRDEESVIDLKREKQGVQNTEKSKR